MFVEILTEPDFEESSWGRAINESLAAAFTKKKVNFSKIESAVQISKKDPTHFLFVIGSDEKTLTSQEIEQVANSVLKRLSKTVNAEIRTI